MQKQRHFPDFIKAYYDYAVDGHCPDSFHYWTGISVVSAALERKCFIRRGREHIFPNMYIMLAGPPAVGKSTAIDPGVLMLKAIREERQRFRILPNQVSMEKLLDILKDANGLEVSPGRMCLQSAGFYYASEASNSIRNVSGSDFLPCLVELYDCRDYERQTLGKPAGMIENPCLSLLAGTTFDYLSVLVSDSSIRGGFASRLIYVIEEKIPDRVHDWEQKDLKLGKEEYYRFLLEDLLLINELHGQFQLSPSVKDQWKIWHTKMHKELQGQKSEDMGSLIGRKSTHLLKLLQVLCVSSASDLIIRDEHWKTAVRMLEDVMKNIELVISQSKMRNTSSQKGLQQVIMRAIGSKIGDECFMKQIRASIVRFGHKPAEFDATMKQLIDAELLAYVVSGSGPTKVRLLDDPNNYL